MYDKYFFDALDKASQQDFDDAAESYDLRNPPDDDPDGDPDGDLDDEEEEVVE